MRLVCRGCLVFGLLLAGTLVGNRMAEETVHAQIRKQEPRAAFLSGSERSEQVLREISQTLKTIDGRLERLEKLAALPPQ